MKARSRSLVRSRPVPAYRFLVVDRGRKLQFRWAVHLYRNGMHVYSTTCRDDAEAYARAVMSCLTFLYTCRSAGTYCAQQVHVALARDAYAKEAERNRARLRDA
jgi:hypothetical protein